jgi:16S rRNA (uracil1498-N3)-methyltransferase
MLFYAPDIAERPVLPDDEALHATRVLRLKEGDTIYITDGRGIRYEALLRNVSPRSCHVDILRAEHQPLPTVGIHLAVAPPKQIDRSEWLVEKATEMGVSSITFLRTRNSERRDINIGRLAKIMVAAMKQSLQYHMPALEGMADFAAFIARPFDGLRAIACCAGERQPLAHTCRQGLSALILIGSEGDFSPEEVAAAQAQHFIPVSLGETRLRTETAALLAAHTALLLGRKNR